MIDSNSYMIIHCLVKVMGDDDMLPSQRTGKRSLKKWGGGAGLFILSYQIN